MVNDYEGYFVVNKDGPKKNWYAEHDLKTLPEYFKLVICNTKKFELRKNDRNFKIGDRVALREFDGKNYTGKVKIVTIKYILKDCPEYGLADGYCIFGW